MTRFVPTEAAMNPQPQFGHPAMLKSLLLLLAALTTLPTPAADLPQSIPLWPNGAPGSEGKTGAEVGKPEGPERNYTTLANIHNPSITPYLPPKDQATGAAVI